LRYNTAVAYNELAQVWADLDGCEGGDFLTGVGDLLTMATGGGYCYSYDEDFTTDRLKEILLAEIEAHKDEATSPDGHHMGYDPERVTLTLEEDKRLRLEIRKHELAA
jgi:hypothetical protein